MRCPHCYGIGEVLKESDDGIGWITKKCRWCNGTGEAEMTNEQWLRTATTEELAETMAERIINSHTMFEYILHQDNRREEDLVREIREWLKEIHE